MREDDWLDEVQAAVHGGSPNENASRVAAAWRERGVELADHEVLGLRFHLGSSRHRRESFLKLRHGILLRTVDAEIRGALVQAWLATPASAHPDWSADLDGFLALVEERVVSGELPEAARELVHHERMMSLVARTESPISPAEDLDQALVLNPSLQVLQLAYAWPEWLIGGRDGWPDLASEPYPMAYVFDPARDKARWVVLDAPALAALRIVAEAVAVGDVAAQMGLPVEQVRAQLQNAAEQALLVAAQPGS